MVTPQRHSSLKDRVIEWTAELEFCLTVENSMEKDSEKQFSAFLSSDPAVKNLPAMQETQGESPGWKDPLEEEMTTHPVFLPEKSHGQRSLVSYSPKGSQRVRRNWAHTHTHKHTVSVTLVSGLTHSTQPSRLPQWSLSPGILALCMVPFTLNQGWPRLTIECNGYADTWLPELGHRSITAPSLVFLICSCGESQLPYCEDTQAASWRQWCGGEPTFQPCE